MVHSFRMFCLRLSKGNLPFLSDTASLVVETGPMVEYIQYHKPKFSCFVSALQTDFLLYYYSFTGWVPSTGVISTEVRFKFTRICWHIYGVCLDSPSFVGLPVWLGYLRLIRS